MTDIIRNFIAYASWYIGRKEKPGNMGFEDPAFEIEMKGAGWNLKDAWCATFIKMVFRKLWKSNPTIYAHINKYFTAGAKLTADNMVKYGLFETGQTPEPGAIVVWLHSKGPSGHMAMIESVDFKTNTMTTIEGNTNASGSREGDRVARKLRTISRDYKAGGLNIYLYIYPRLKQ